MSDESTTEDQQTEPQTPKPESPQPLNVSRRGIAVGLAGVVIIVALLIVAVRQGDDDPVDTAPTAAANVDEGQQGGGEEVEGVELGSVTLSAHICPSLDSPDDQCLSGEQAEVTSVAIVLPDGSRLGLDTATEMPDGTYQWLNVPIGVYQMPGDELEGPEGLVARNVSGPVVPNAEGWEITNTDPNQPAVVRILFAPIGGTPAAG